jgi:hypothetical protein
MFLFLNSKIFNSIPLLFVKCQKDRQTSPKLFLTPHQFTTFSISAVRRELSKNFHSRLSISLPSFPHYLKICFLSQDKMKAAESI